MGLDASVYVQRKSDYLKRQEIFRKIAENNRKQSDYFFSVADKKYHTDEFQKKIDALPHDSREYAEGLKEFRDLIAKAVEDEEFKPVFERNMDESDKLVEELDSISEGEPIYPRGERGSFRFLTENFGKECVKDIGDGDFNNVDVPIDRETSAKLVEDYMKAITEQNCRVTAELALLFNRLNEYFGEPNYEMEKIMPKLSSEEAGVFFDSNGTLVDSRIRFLQDVLSAYERDDIDIPKEERIVIYNANY